MDKIFMNEMEFYGYHGVFPEETKLGQRFRVSAVIEADLQPAGCSDDLKATVNYAEVYELCKEIVEGRPYQLIEAVAERIAGAILDSFGMVQSTTIKVIKPGPPIPGIYESVAVEITRRRHE
ncbi:dihydroneopterin aldolase [Siminovitchia sp. 179-K 8D1 HS]|uniref:dihydroneopterin aldolase n=1 Tax=Siminovitchia sp. 179-K 8D1 HS TaxID=3142385 RepID=UPI0039A07CEC